MVLYWIKEQTGDGFVQIFKQVKFLFVFTRWELVSVQPDWKKAHEWVAYKNRRDELDGKL